MARNKIDGKRRDPCMHIPKKHDLLSGKEI
jgi:hypothetical protein